MTLRFRIYCVQKTNKLNSRDIITHIGGLNGDYSKWKLTVEEAIIHIENMTYDFFVRENGKSLNVIISKDSKGNKYLQTFDGGEISDVLLNLPECP